MCSCARDGRRRRVDSVDGAGRACRSKHTDRASCPETSQARLSLAEVVTVGQHVSSTPFVCIKNTATSQGRGQRCSWYHLVLIIAAQPEVGQIILYTALTGYIPEYPTAAEQRHFEHSTSEPHSRVVSGEGSHPVAFILWRVCSLYSARSRSFICFLLEELIW